jgi:hypothetical protein
VLDDHHASGDDDDQADEREGAPHDEYCMGP